MFHFLVLVTDELQILDLPAGIVDPVTQTSILRHALLHVFNMDILFHTDIFFYEILQTYIHTKRDGALKQQRKFFCIQSAQINLIKLFSKSLIMGTEIAFFPGIGCKQPAFHLIDRHRAI